MISLATTAGLFEYGYTFNPDFFEKVEGQERLFVNPDGSYLAFAVPWKRGGQGSWVLGHWHDQLVKPLDRSKEGWKRQLCKLGLRTSRTGLFFIAGDFDKLWGEFEKLGQKEGWAAVRAMLEKLLPLNSVVVATPSRKAKIIICFQYEGNPLELSRAQMFDALKSVLPADLAPHLDTKGTALDVVFLYGLEMITKLSVNLPFLKPIAFPAPHASQGASLLPSPAADQAGSTTTLLLPAISIPSQPEPYLGPLPHSLKPYVSRNPGKECLLRFLLNAYGEELAISSLYFAKRIRECFPPRRTSQPKVSTYLRDFQEAGLMEVADAFFRPAVAHRKGQAKLYRITGPLLEARGELQSLAPVRPKSSFSLSAQIEDGQWTSKLFSAALAIKDPRSYAAWVLSRNGFHADPTRFKRAVAAWADAEKRRRDPANFNYEHEKRAITARLKAGGRDNE